MNRLFIQVTFLLLGALALSGCQAPERGIFKPSAQEQCRQSGWQELTVAAAGLNRSVLWKAPRVWRHGAIIVLHGGGGSHHNFCGGGKLIQPQIDFANSAVAQGFAVFLLDSTDDVVTDVTGRQCGKRFDFSVLNRPNIDLPFIGKVIDSVVPRFRPRGSSQKIFLTGLSSGGYMAIRAATHFDDRISAFAPVSAGDPYGTEINCDASLTPRRSAKGTLLDLETGKRITEPGACRASRYPNEHQWDSQNPPRKPRFKQFYNEGDGIVDISCKEKVRYMLGQHGYIDTGEYKLKATHRNFFNHLWLKRYNQPLLDFFKE